MIDAGTLNERMSIQSPPETRDAHGGIVEGGSWTTTETRWGSLDTISSREFLYGGQMADVVTHKIRFRVGAVVKSGWRISCGEAFYYVVGSPVLKDDDELIVMVQERGEQ